MNDEYNVKGERHILHARDIVLKGYRHEKHAHKKEPDEYGEHAVDFVVNAMDEDENG